MPRAYALFSAVCLGLATIPFLAERTDLPAVALVSGRVWTGAAALAAVEVWRRRRRAGAPPPGPAAGRPPLAGRGSPGARLVCAGLALAVHWTLMFAAYEQTPPATVIFVIFLAPVAIAALAPGMLDERPARSTLFALALAVAGFVLVAGPEVRLSGGGGIGLAAASGAALALFVILSKPLAERYGGARATLGELSVAGVALLPLAARAPWGPPRAGWGWLVVLGLVHTAFATALYLWALARLPATHVGILGYLEPAGVVLLGWGVTGAAPTAATVAGGALIVAAGSIVALHAARAGSEVLHDVPR